MVIWKETVASVASQLSGKLHCACAHSCRRPQSLSTASEAGLEIKWNKCSSSKIAYFQLKWFQILHRQRCQPAKACTTIKQILSMQRHSPPLRFINPWLFFSAHHFHASFGFLGLLPNLPEKLVRLVEVWEHRPPEAATQKAALPTVGEKGLQHAATQPSTYLCHFSVNVTKWKKTEHFEFGWIIMKLIICFILSCFFLTNSVGVLYSFVDFVSVCFGIEPGCKTPRRAMHFSHSQVSWPPWSRAPSPP